MRYKIEFKWRPTSSLRTSRTFHADNVAEAINSIKSTQPQIEIIAIWKEVANRRETVLRILEGE